MHKFEDLLREPELAAEATALPLRSFPLDCAILFSDITAPFLESDLGLEFKEGIGPVFSKAPPLRDLAERLSGFETPLRLAESVRAAGREFPKHGFIGFAGAPFTLAAYLAGTPVSEGIRRLKDGAAKDAPMVTGLLARLADLAAGFLRIQADAGADALMLFDTWAGPAGLDVFAEFAAKAARRCVDAVRTSGLPVIYYTRSTASIVDSLRATGADVHSIDDSVLMDRASAALGGLGLQGNLDPSVFLKDEHAVRAAVGELLAKSRGVPGHIFNTARGIEPEAVPALVGLAAEMVTGKETGP